MVKLTSINASNRKKNQQKIEKKTDFFHMFLILHMSNIVKWRENYLIRLSTVQPINRFSEKRW